ncbi:MAG: CoA transferase [Dehalococcoidia bacterium]|nr:CoA transferase [Dehalococcoidia bacterium]
MGGRALEGLKVLEWGGFIAAPYCAELLAQMGADLVKIESPGAGDESRRYGPFPGDRVDAEKSGLFLSLNVNKRGITLDPEKTAGKAVLLDLLTGVDIFVVNQPWIDLCALELDYESLHRLYPGLIVASITPYGSTGSYKNWKGYDLNCCALGGITSTIGYPDREPLTPPLSQGHFQAGLTAATAVMFAVLHRDLTGEGQLVDISEAEVWATIHTGMGIQGYLEEGRVRKRSGHIVPHFPYPDVVLPCKDGSVIIDTPQNRQWGRLLTVMGNPEWANDPIFKDRIRTTDEYSDKADAYLTEWLLQHTKAEIFKLLQDARVPAAPLRTVEEVVNDEHLQQRQFFVDVNQAEVGTLKYPGVCYQLSATPFVVERPSPRLGEHNEEVYCGQLGYAHSEIARLRREGAI